jgi:hypothetical protein
VANYTCYGTLLSIIMNEFFLIVEPTIVKIEKFSCSSPYEKIYLRRIKGRSSVGKNNLTQIPEARLTILSNSGHKEVILKLPSFEVVKIAVYSFK